MKSRGTQSSDHLRELDHFSSLSKLVVGEILSSGNPMGYVYDLCDRVGPRPAGSRAEEEASRYLVDRFRSFGLQNVRLEPFDAPHWTRGKSKVEILRPVQRPITALALPLNTSHELEAEVIWAPFETESEFRRLAPHLQGKICLNRATPRVGMSGSMLHRSERMRLAAEAGARGFLWVSNWPGQVLSTGSMDPDTAAQMPAFGVTLEDGLLLQRLMDSSSDSVRLRIMTENTTDRGTSWNVSADFGADDGAMAMVTAHHDSHDITTGAFDNAAGCAVVLECARVIARHFPVDGPRFRFVIFSAEEVGLHGSHSYVEQHHEELDSIRMLLNADGLGAAPSTKYIHVPFRDELVDYIREAFHGSALAVDVERALALNWDHAPFALQGVPVASLTAKWPAGTLLHYGHTSADTPDKLDPQDLRYAAACSALLATKASAEPDWKIGRLHAQEVRKRLEADSSRNRK